MGKDTNSNNNNGGGSSTSGVVVDGGSDNGGKTKTVSNPFKGCSAGDTITFGTYGGEDIRWRVLTIDGSNALVITEKVVDAVPYYSSYSATSWSSSYLRSWMNGTFFSQAFTSDQQNYICTTTVQAGSNPNKGTSGGSDTTDRVFALSYDEANKYFKSNSDRLAVPTDYAKSHGALTVNPSKATPWWLRTPGATSRDAMYIWGATGAIDYNGYGVDQSDYGARPAMYVVCK